jgi:hypothetical protein
MAGSSSALSTPQRRRRPDWRPRFLEAFRASGNVRLATNAAGIDRSTPYRRAERDPTFAAQWAEAGQDAIDVLEAEARRRALNQSDRLLMFLLKAERPQKYRDQMSALDYRHILEREAERAAVEYGLDPKEVIAEAKQMIARHPR